ncbi:MAG TPA: hypothetical protein VE153_06790, partial [Myxococcus sp.]|nr:hypothetical protein [Myxococcus sp.]
VHKLPREEWARFEMGFAFIEGTPEAVDLIKKALDPEGPGGPGRPRRPRRPDGPGGSGGPRSPAAQASLGVRGYRAGWKAG